MLAAARGCCSVAQSHGIGRCRGNGAPAGGDGGGISGGQRSAQRGGVGGEGLSQRLAVGGGKASPGGQGGGHAVGDGHTIPCRASACGERSRAAEVSKLARRLAGAPQAAGGCTEQEMMSCRARTASPLPQLLLSTTPCAHLSQGNGSAAVASGESIGRGLGDGHATISKGLGGGCGHGSAACQG